MATWPTGVFAPTSRGPNLDDAVTHTGTHDAEQAEIVAIEQSLGVGVKGGYASVAARLSGGLIETFSATGSAVTTSGTAWSIVCSLTIPAQTVAGTVMIQSFLRLDKTAPTDPFSISLFNGVIEAAGEWPALNNNNQYIASPNGRITLAASTSAVLTLQIARFGGSGSAQTYAQYNLNHIDALWIAS